MNLTREQKRKAARREKKISDRLKHLALCFHTAVQNAGTEPGKVTYDKLFQKHNLLWIKWAMIHKPPASPLAFKEYLNLCK